MRSVGRGPVEMVRRLAARSEGGQAMVEFAFVGIPFFLLVLGFIDFGRGVLYYNMIGNAAREAARAGIVASRTSEQLCSVALRVVSLPGVNPPAPPACGPAGLLTVEVPDRGTPGVPADPVRVRVTYRFTLALPVFGNLVEESPGCRCITLGATSSMYVEN